MKKNEIDRIIDAGYCSPIRDLEYDPKTLRRKLRALVKKAYKHGFISGHQWRMYGGDSPEIKDEHADIFKETFGVHP